MKEKITPFLRRLSGSPAIRNQYYTGPEESGAGDYNDPLMEDTHEVVKGLVHKYRNRALIKVSYQCAAHCRFCTRIRQIGNPSGTLVQNDIEAILSYLKSHPETDDVILSGGDPLYTPSLTALLLAGIRKIDSVKVIRIGTRLPFQLPGAFTSKALVELLEQVDELGKKMPFYILVHIAHPDELTPESITVLKQLRKLKVTLLSQTVFLKGINDDFDSLYSLFKKLYHLGVMPYYLYHCDAVNGLEHFRGDMAAEKLIAERLRAELSGIGCPLFVEDVEKGYGKMPV
jgi:lysine 2,3-aminomutase